jgi:hypothetical protein
MAKSNKERQAEFREKMRAEGRQALHVWVTAGQAQQIQAILAGLPLAPLQVTPRRTSANSTFLVTTAARKLALPAIPPKTPASIARLLQADVNILQKKLTQIEKLQKDAEAIEKQFRRTVEECGQL